MTVSLSDIKAARERISPYVLRTPLLRVPVLDEVLGCRVYLKPENLQHTGSFKLRGATSHLTQMSDEEKKRGVVTASSGNHGQGVACAAQRLGIDAVVVVPENCNPTKVAGLNKYGARVIFEGLVASKREAKAQEIVETEGRRLVHPYDDFYVKAGQGTIGLEILEDQPEMDMVVVPIGGGGIISGIATAIKETDPKVKVIGVEPAGAARYIASQKAGEPVTLDHVDTIADGTRTDHAVPENLAIINRYVDGLVTAGEDEIINALRLVVSGAKIVAEPSSVMGVAVAAAGRLPAGPDDNVCFVLTGGNNDLEQLAKVLTGQL